MFCEKCGAQVDNDSKFCLNCGAPVTPEAPPAAAPVAAPAAPAAPSFFSNKKNVMILGIVAAVIIIGIIVGVVIANLPTTIYMDDFITIEYEGLSTKGEADMHFDQEAFMARLKEEMTEQEAYTMLMQLGNAGMDLQLEAAENLTNGDEIYILFSVNNEIAKEYGVQLEVKNSTIKVEALREPVFLDLFADLELTFTGCSPYADVTYENKSTNEFIKKVDFYISNSYNLEEGEKFTIEAYYSEYDAEEAGYIILESTKEYTATNLPKPVELNPFDYVEVVFTGLEGSGYAEAVKSQEIDFMDYIRFEFNKSSSLTEGETITLAYSIRWNADPLEYGYVLPETTTKQFTVPKLGKYITDFTELTEDGRNSAIAGALEEAKLSVTKESNDNRTSSIKLYNTNFNSLNELSYATGLSNVKLHSVIAAQDQGWFSNTDYLCFIFTVDITGHSNIANGGDATGYFFMYLKNPIMKGDGTLEFDFEDRDLSYYRYCFLTYEDLQSYCLASYEVQNPYTPAA